MRKANLFTQLFASYGLAILVFAVLLSLSIYHLIVLPATQRMVNDFSSLIMLSAKTWLELPPMTRPDFETELLLAHEMSLQSASTPLSGSAVSNNAYLDLLTESLEWKLETPISFFEIPQQHTRWYWTDIRLSGKLLRLGFSEMRVRSIYVQALISSALAGLLIVMLLTAATSYRITRPLRRLIDATRAIGTQPHPPHLPRSSVREIDALSLSFGTLDEKIRRLLASKNILISGISHDLRTPLARMSLALELLQSDQDPGLKQQLQTDIEVIDGIIGQTLELSREMKPLALTVIDMGYLLRAIIADYTAPDCELQLSSDTPCTLLAAEIPLRRIITNLIDNAIQHGGASRVVLGYTQSPDKREILLSISDNGSGIDQSLHEAIFQPFFKADSSRSRAGSGLGLAIARQLAEAYGWSVELKPNTATGSEFIIRLPMIEPPG